MQSVSPLFDSKQTGCRIRLMAALDPFETRSRGITGILVEPFEAYRSECSLKVDELLFLHHVRLLVRNHFASLSTSSKTTALDAWATALYQLSPSYRDFVTYSTPGCHSRRHLLNCDKVGEGKTNGPPEACKASSFEAEWGVTLE